MSIRRIRLFRRNVKVQPLYIVLHKQFCNCFLLPLLSWLTCQVYIKREIECLQIVFNFKLLLLYLCFSHCKKVLSELKLQKFSDRAKKLFVSKICQLCDALILLQMIDVFACLKQKIYIYETCT